MAIDLSIIVAMTPERVIGNNGELPWQQLPSDLNRFKRITMRLGTVIMGCNTYTSILARNGKPLTGRKHIVLTRRCLSSDHESVKFVRSTEEVFAEVAAFGGRACIVGGEEIYKIFLPIPLVRTMFVTIVHSLELDGDAFFPERDNTWRCLYGSATRRWDPKDQYFTSFKIYKR